LSKPCYVAGIDLGTTNSCLAYTDLGSVQDPRELPAVELFPIEQLVNPGEVRPEPLLPSSLYIPGPRDFSEGMTALPWSDTPGFVVGRLAQLRGVENASRLVSSAKSWLSYTGVDRTSPILPASAPEGVARISPVDASRRYLEHFRLAWNHGRPAHPLEEQHAFITVPASFDAVARELTIEAARRAGFKDVQLLEEPQAAFYAWIERHPDWRERVQVGDLILVIDIGGGTTDFTLIAVKEEAGELRLERVAVGDHILLGGDNIDLALARSIEMDLAARKTRLDAMQFHALWQKCRVAKEALLEEGSRAQSHPVTILGRGSGVVGGAVKLSLERERLNAILLDGFFPMVASNASPQRLRRAALQEIGLPYAADAAVTRHLAGFLLQQDAGFASPTHVLFNGGVLRAAAIRSRLLEVLNSWAAERGRAFARELQGGDLMHAVARGAAYYGLALQGRGIRIRGGIARTYYVGVETAMPAVPGMPAPLKALTVAPFGMEEGTSVRMPASEFGLITGEPAEFRFFTSVARKYDQPGAVLDEFGDEIEELSPIEVTLASEGNQGQLVRVTLETVITETGLLQLWCVARDGRRWKLEFNVRQRIS
jgi:molecular chaperone DnaK (HSP70)